MTGLIGTGLKRLLARFWALHKVLVRRNIRFKNIHAGETCYIFANGASLKYYDISKVPNLPSIVCNYSLADKRLQGLDIKYCTWGDSYSLYPLFYNTYDHIQRFQCNKIRAIFKRIVAKNQHIQFFVSLTNFYSAPCRSKNINYLYHFGDKTSSSYDSAGKFATCRGGLSYMIGLAKYFGFSKAILIGCDYLGSPPVEGHFYADSRPRTGIYHAEYCSKTKVEAEGIDILVILPEGSSSPDFKFDSYERYFELTKSYVENKELIDSKYLELMREAAVSTQIFM